MHHPARVRTRVAVAGGRSCVMLSHMPWSSKVLNHVANSKHMGGCIVSACPLPGLGASGSVSRLDVFSDPASDIRANRQTPARLEQRAGGGAWWYRPVFGA